MTRINKPNSSKNARISKEGQVYTVSFFVEDSCVFVPSRTWKTEIGAIKYATNFMNK